MNVHLRQAADVRMRIADQNCPVRQHTGEHRGVILRDWRYWFRPVEVCASCDFVGLRRGHD